MAHGLHLFDLHLSLRWGMIVGAVVIIAGLTLLDRWANRKR